MADTAGDLVRAFLAAMDEGVAAKTASFLSEDALFVRPVILASASTGGTEDFGPMEIEPIHGRAAAEAFFERRGKKSHVHRVLTTATSGKTTFAEGVVVEPASSALFMCCVDIEDGKITRCLSTSTRSTPEVLELVRATAG